MEVYDSIFFLYWEFLNENNLQSLQNKKHHTKVRVSRGKGGGRREIRKKDLKYTNIFKASWIE